MTEHLQLWKADADAMCIPESIQRGLAFMAGIDLVVNGAPVNQADLPIVAARFSEYLPNLPDGIGGDFTPGPIAELLYDLALKFDPDFTPRILTLPSGATFEAIQKLPGTRLPPLDPYNLATASIVAKSLYSQIGSCIHDVDLEAALIGGLKFFDGYYQVDSQSTLNMCRYALRIRPPHMVWISRCVLYELDDLPFWDITANTFDAFFLEQREEKVLCRTFYDTLRNTDLAPALTDTRIESFKALCIQAAQDFVQQPGIEGLMAACQESILTDDAAPFREDLSEALVDLDAEMVSRWGYIDMTDSSAGEPYLGEICDQICCIVWSALRSAIKRKCG